MRHLRVPSAETQHWLDLCRSQGWLQTGAGVLSLDDGLKGIPLSQEAPSDNDESWAGHTIFSAPGLIKGPEHWSEHLSPELLEEIKEHIPKSYEVQGDVLIVKLEEEIRTHGEAIAQAMLKQLPSVRLVCADNGVIGEFRVRDLQPLRSRNGDLSTVTQIRENGVLIFTDPAKVYFSARLSKEREDNLSAAKKLREKLSRALRICDPYAGVGPSLAPLLRENDLVSHCFAGDLNPDAFELLKKNTDRFISKLNPPQAIIEVKNIDARNWLNEVQIESKIDYLLVNLPHHSLEHLPELLPLLSKNHPTVIRGWAIIEKSSILTQSDAIKSMLESAGASVDTIYCSEVKGFSSSKIFMRFESWQTFY